jgi:hypothetical protein
VRKHILIILAIVAMVTPLAAQDRLDEEELHRFKRGIERASEDAGWYQGYPNYYSYDWAIMKVVSPEVFRQSFSACDWYRIKKIYHNNLKNLRWESALWNAYNMAIIAPDRVDELNLHESDWQSMKDVFLKCYRAYPEYSLNIAAKLLMLFPDQFAELGEELEDVRKIVEPKLQQYASDRYYWLYGFLPTYGHFKIVFPDREFPIDWEKMEENFDAWSRMWPPWDFHRAKKAFQALVARDGVSVLLKHERVNLDPVPEESCEPPVVRGFRLETGFNIGLNFNGPSYWPGLYVGTNMMFFRLSKHLRVGGIGFGYTWFGGSGSYVPVGDRHGRDGQWTFDYNGARGFIFSVIPIKYRRLALGITPYKKKILRFHPRGESTRGIVFTLSLNY